MAITEETAKHFDAAMPPKSIKLAQEVRTAAQGDGLSFYAGDATVASGGTSITVTGLDSKWNAARVMLTPAQADTGNSIHWFGAVASGTLTITVDAAPGTALKFNYLLVAYTALT